MCARMVIRSKTSRVQRLLIYYYLFLNLWRKYRLVGFEVFTAVVMIWRRVVRCVATDVSEEHSASIFRVEEKSSKPTSKQVAAETRRHIPEYDTLQV
jgi:hypothetical protein